MELAGGNPGSLADYQQLLDSASDAIVVCDLKTREILYANALAAVYGISSGAAAGTCYSRILGFDAPCKDCPLGAFGPAGDAGSERFNSKTGRWEHVNCTLVTWCGRDAFTANIHDITIKKQEEMGYTQLVHELLVINPQALCAFRLDLTRNTCDEGHGISDYIQSAVAASTADRLFENIASLITDPEDKRMFRAKFNRRDLLASFEAGSDRRSIDYRRMREDGSSGWVTSFINMIRNPQTNDVEAAIYSLDITERKRGEQIVEVITDAEFDFIALIDPVTGALDFRHFGKDAAKTLHMPFLESGRLTSYDQFRQAVMEGWLLADDVEEFNRNSPLDKVLEGLGQAEEYEFSMRSNPPNGAMSCRRMSFRYLDSDRDNIILVQTDVTDLYLAQQREVEHARMEAEQSRDILNSISAGVCVLHMPDPDHASVSFMNDRMYRLLGFDLDANDADQMSDEVDTGVLSYVADVFSGVHPNDLERMKAIFRKGYQENSFIVPAVRLAGAGGVYHLITIEGELRDAKPGEKVFYGTYRDVSGEMRLQAKLTEELQEEKRLKEEADSANRSKSEFLSQISHDIRTPMNVITSMSDFAIRDIDNRGLLLEDLSEIRTSSSFLLSLINDILDISKIDSGQMELHPERLSYDEFSSDMRSILKHLCEEKGIDFEVRESTAIPAIMVDRVRLEQVMLNLLSNAVKYTPGGGHVWLSTAVDVKAPGKLAITCRVKDDGIGMSESFQKVMYEPFTQEHRHSTPMLSVRGTGLGLAIVKKDVGLMGGTIEVRSKLEEGTEFVVTFPADEASASVANEAADAGSRQAKDAPAGERADISGTSALVAEDHPINRAIVGRLLGEWGVAASFAANGREAVELFKCSPRGTFDVILMDIQMPQMDGYEATRTIRALAREDARTVPIIAMTADAYDEDVKASLGAGMDAHVSKPLDADKLHRTIARLVNKA